MCYKPSRLLAYEYTVDGIPKNLILWNTQPLEYSVGLVIIDKDNSYRMSSKMKKQFIRDGLKLPLYFKKRIEIPCNQCVDCCKRRAKEWSVRCELEAKQYKFNYFVTLTYNNENIKYNYWTEWSADEDGDSVRKRRSTTSMEDVSKFIKLLRQEFKRKFDEDGIRFFACTEYGSKTHRPHAHLILFNCNLRDLRYHALSKTGQRMFRSSMLENIWKKGYVTVQAYSQECARYVAQYCTKKLKKSNVPLEHCEEERINMSRRPGIGSSWFNQNVSRIFTPIYDNGEISFADKVPLAKPGEASRNFNLPSAFVRKLKRVTDSKRGIYNEPSVYSDLVLLDNDEYICLDKLYYKKYLPWKTGVNEYARRKYLESIGYGLADSYVDLNWKDIDDKKVIIDGKFNIKRDIETYGKYSDGIQILTDDAPLRRKTYSIITAHQLCLFE